MAAQENQALEELEKSFAKKAIEMFIQVNEFGSYLSKKSNRLLVMYKGKVQKEFSLDNIDVLMLGKGVSLSTDLLTDMCESGITIFFDFNNKYFMANSSFLSMPETRIKQAMMSPEKKLELAKGIISAKVFNQSTVLEAFEKSTEGMAEPELNELQAVMTFEAQSARYYWKNIRSMLTDYSFYSREPRNGDIVNTCFDYGYGVLRNCVFKAVLNASLDPYIGVIHETRNYKPTFVFDIMEIFRPAVDFSVVSTLLEKKWESFNEVKYPMVNKIMDCIYSEYKFKGQSSQMLRIMSLQCYSIADFIAHDGELDFFKVKEWKK